MKKKYGGNHLRKEEKESSKKGMNKKNELRYCSLYLWEETEKKLNENINKIKNHF